VVLDPFQPEREEDVAHLKALQQEVHETFIEMVKLRRGDVLSAAPDLFSGLFWTGRTARDLGLVDQIGDLRTVMRARFGKETELKLIGGQRSLLRRRSGVGGVDLAASPLRGLADEALAAVEERLIWARYGL